MPQAKPALSNTVSGGRVNAYNALTVTSDGVLEVSPNVKDRYVFAGSNLTMYLQVTDVGLVTNATVTGTIEGSPPVVFADDGQWPDELANDARYSAVLPVPTNGPSLRLNVAVGASGKAPYSNTFELPIIYPAPNDLFAHRIAMTLDRTNVWTGLYTKVGGNNFNATKEPGEPNHAGNRGGCSIWWTWTAPAATQVMVDTGGSGAATVLAVYTGSDVSHLTEVASAGYDAWGDCASVQFGATPGTAYQIAVDGNEGEQGPITLHLATGSFQPAQIVQPLADRIGAPGGNLTFQVEAWGTEPLRYQWWFSNTWTAAHPIPEVSLPRLVLENLTTQDVGDYWVIVSNWSAAAAR